VGANSHFSAYILHGDAAAKARIAITIIMCRITPNARPLKRVRIFLGDRDTPGLGMI